MTRVHSYSMGVIGNCSYMALINKDANINWLCWPRFDSSFVFGGLLSEQKGGRFCVQPASEHYESRQYYLENTNVLCTEFEVSDGRFRVLDWAPRFEQYERSFKPLMLMRKVELLEGRPKIRVICRPVGHYGELTPKPVQGSSHIRYLGLDAPTRLTTNVPLSYVMEERSFLLSDDRYLVFTWGPPLEASLPNTCERFLKETVSYWRHWVERCGVPAFAQKPIIRSALVLKIHQFEDTGAIIASATTSLPESPKSTRNWDYRYCWLRDTYYTLSAFNHIGQFDEMIHFSDYVQQIASQDLGRMQPVYGITGEAQLLERELPLEGYLGNQPVRVGNQAHEHIQNDLYGQILLSLLPLYVDHRFVDSRRLSDKTIVEKVLDWIEITLEEPDAGLWELRNKQQRHCYTFLFHWAGCAAASQIAQRLGAQHMEERAARLMKRAAQGVEACYDEDLGVYTHAVDSPHMDASLLQLITMGYLDPKGERAHRLLERIEDELMVKPGLLYRYRHPDDFGTPQVCFVVCGFWYAEALACVGRVEEAMAAFENLMACSNHLNLLSEDATPTDFSQWGNFPQTYSHVGVINAAYRIAKKLDLPAFLSPTSLAYRLHHEPDAS